MRAERGRKSEDGGEGKSREVEKELRSQLREAAPGRAPPARRLRRVSAHARPVPGQRVASSSFS